VGVNGANAGTITNKGITSMSANLNVITAAANSATCRLE